MAKVAVVNVPPKPFEEEVLEAVKEGIHLVGGLQKFVKPGSKVLVKPNICSLSLAITADRKVTWSTAKVLKEYGCDVTIGENPVVDCPSMKLFSKPEVLRTAEKAGVKILNLRADEHVKVKVPNPKFFEEFTVSKTALTSDLIVGVPTMRRHWMSGATLSIKNMYGTVSTTQRHIIHRKGLYWGLAEINKVLRPGLIVMDGINASGDGVLYPIGLLMVGDDPVAVDTIASMRMGWKPGELETIRYAHELGVGEMNPEKIELLGASLDDIREEGKKLRGKLSHYWKNPSDIASEAGNVEIVKGDPCTGCLTSLSAALGQIGPEKLSKGPNMAILVGPNARPSDGKLNIIVGGCLRKFKDKGIFVDFCPSYGSDIKGALEQALGLSASFEYVWERILQTREKGLPGV